MQSPTGGILLKLDGAGEVSFGETNQLLKKKLLLETYSKRKHVQDLKECNGSLPVTIFLSHFPLIDDQDQSYILKMLGQSAQVFKFLPNSLKQDETFLLKCLEVDGKLFSAIYTKRDLDGKNQFLSKILKLESVVKI